MSDFDRAGYADLSSVEYLLDPPESVWEGVLSMDHATWLEIKDLDVIERIEIVRGPGSALYGTSAMFAVVNGFGICPPEHISYNSGLAHFWGVLRVRVDCFPAVCVWVVCEK